MTPDQIESRDYTYVQVFLKPGAEAGVSVRYFLVDTKRRAQARAKAEAWAAEQWGDSVASIHLYPGNYVARARTMLTQGLVAGTPARSNSLEGALSL